MGVVRLFYTLCIRLLNQIFKNLAIQLPVTHCLRIISRNNTNNISLQDIYELATILNLQNFCAENDLYVQFIYEIVLGRVMSFGTGRATSM